MWNLTIMVVTHQGSTLVWTLMMNNFKDWEKCRRRLRRRPVRTASRRIKYSKTWSTRLTVWTIHFTRTIRRLVSGATFLRSPQFKCLHLLWIAMSAATSDLKATSLESSQILRRTSVDFRHQVPFKELRYLKLQAIMAYLRSVLLVKV